MIVHVLLIGGDSFDVSMSEDFTYDSLVSRIAAIMKVTTHSISLYHNRKRLGCSWFYTVGDIDINVTVLPDDQFPTCAFPRAAWSFSCDMGRFPSTSIRTMFPETTIRQSTRDRLWLRDVIPNAGYEFDDPFSCRPTLAVQPRNGFQYEEDAMRQGASGEMEDRRRARVDAEATWKDFEASLSIQEMAAVERLDRVGLERIIALRAFFECNRDELAAFRVLSYMKNQV